MSATRGPGWGGNERTLPTWPHAQGQDVWPRNEKTGCVVMGDEMTGAELLREAARLMRERAEVRPRGSWDASTIGLAPAEHIAGWHPGVALAVADWLEATADDLEIEDDHDGWDSNVYTAAVATARAYLSAPVSAGEPTHEVRDEQ